MSSDRLTVPPPSPDDHEDVAWALRAASAQWRRHAHTDAVAWVERAAETAEEVGQIQRSIELLQLVAALKREARASREPGPPSAVAPPSLAAPPPAAAPPVVAPPVVAPQLPPAVAPPPPSVAMAPPLPPGVAPPPLPPGARAALPSIEVEVEEVDFDEVEELEDIEELDASPAVGDDTRTFLQELPRFGADWAAQAAAPPAPVPPAPTGGISLGDLRGLVKSEVENEPASENVVESEPRWERGAPSDPFGAGPSDAEEEHPTDPPAEAPFDSTTDVTEPALLDGDFEEPGTDPSNEFGELDFTDEAPTSRRSVDSLDSLDALDPLGPRITPPSYHAATGGLDLDLSSPAEVAMSRRSEQLPHDHDDLERELGVDLSIDVNQPPLAPRPAPPLKPPPASRTVGMASVRPSRPPGAPDRIAHTGPEPFAHAPSASLPPVEPPSRPSQAPPAISMREPAPWVGTPAPARVDGPQEPVGAIPSAPPLPRIEQPRAEEERPPSMRVRGTVVDGIDLLNVPGLQDLPEEAQLALLQSVQVMRLERGVEAASFGVALVTHGAVQLMPTIADAACALARKGEVIFTQGSLATGVELRVVGFDPGSRVALFSRASYEAAIADCPWVADELAVVADKYQALAGAVMGPLGDSLDDMFRSMVLEKCTVKRPRPGDVLATRGKALDGWYVVGAGAVDVVGADGAVKETLGPGDFLFPHTLLGGSAAPDDARVSPQGALLLYATRMSTHELLATCPPFIELLAG